MSDLNLTQRKRRKRRKKRRPAASLVELPNVFALHLSSMMILVPEDVSVPQ